MAIPNAAFAAVLPPSASETIPPTAAVVVAAATSSATILTAAIATASGERLLGVHGCRRDWHCAVGALLETNQAGPR